MTRRLSSLHARAICHATEDVARVEEAMRNVVGDTPINQSRTEGHFGNPLVVLESKMEDEARILDVLGRLNGSDREKVASTLDTRTDASCHVFLRLDKQRAYAGELRLSEDDDVIALRIKVRAFPAKSEAAVAVMGEVLGELADDGEG